MVSYGIAPPATGGYPFTIDNITGIITTNNELDREIVAEFNLTVEASDGNGVPTKATVCAYIM